MTPFRQTKRYYPIIAFALLTPLLLAGCTTYGSRRDYLERMIEYLPAPTRPVIVIPGFGNSRLYDPVARNIVWGSGWSMFQTSYADDLDLPIDRVRGEFGHDRLVPDGNFAGYRAQFNIAFSLRTALKNFGRYADPDDDHASAAAVYTFAYDWRLSATTNAHRLGVFIDSIRDRSRPASKVDLVAHSAGGMIALAYLKMGGLGPESPLEEIDSASRAAGSKVSTVTLIGVPQKGTNETVRALARGDRLFLRELSPAMMASFLSLPEMLPEEGAVFIDPSGERLDLDVWDPGAWEALGFAVWADEPSTELRHAFARSLERARHVRELLRRPMPDGVRQTVIASDCVPTASRILLRKDGSLAFYPWELARGEARLGARMFVPGDGSVETRSALGSSESDSVFCAGHHEMASDPGVHRTMIRSLLAESEEQGSGVGTTARQHGSTSMETPNTR